MTQLDITIAIVSHAMMGLFILSGFYDLISGLTARVAASHIIPSQTLSDTAKTRLDLDE